MARSSPNEVRDRYYCDSSKTRVEDALLDCLLALMSEDAPDSTPNPVAYVTERVAGLVGRDAVAYRYISTVFNRLSDQYERKN